MSQRATERSETQQMPRPPEHRSDFGHGEESHAEEHVEQRETSRSVVDRRVWSPAQFVAGAIGLFLVVLGAVALLRSGFETMTSPTATVLGYTHTPLMAIISIVMGAMFLAAAASTLGVRGTLTFLGLLSLGFGLVMAIEPGQTSSWLGGGTSLGVLYAIIGGVSLVAGWASPTIMQRRTSTRSGHDRMESDARS
jgi:hypothetical protein